jgi:rubrerythrin
MDALEFAVKMELDGEKYYREQAAVHQGNGLNTVFLMLAQDEKNHARILIAKSGGAAYELSESAVSARKNIFHEMTGYINKIKECPGQADLYDVAMDIEKRSIDLYTKLLEETADERPLFEYLVRQETRHLEIVEEIILLVTRPNEWVEAAEFGKRDDY